MALTLVCIALTAACSGGEDAAAPSPTAAPAVSADEAKRTLEQVILRTPDIAPDYAPDTIAFRDNAEAAALRPDAAAARQQYDGWGQVLSLDVQYAAPAAQDLLFGGKTARVQSGASVFTTPGGAAEAMTYLRELPGETVAEYIEYAARDSDTKLRQTRVRQDDGFTPAADDSFVLRATGTATLATGLEVNYVADTVFVRVGNTNGSITTVALGQPPKRDELERLVSTFVERARARGAG